MLWIFFIWIITAVYFTVKHQWKDFAAFLKTLDKQTLFLTLLFFLAGIISLFVSGFDQKKLGAFVVLFLQPISLFFITGFTIKQKPGTKSLLLTACYLLLAAMGVYAVIQYFTLFGLPAAYWGNNDEPKRAVGFFSHPNFYALFSAPLLALLIPDVAIRIKNWKLETCLPARQVGNWKFIIAWLLGALGLFLSLSRAGWLGLGMAIVIYAIAAADKKTRIAFLGLAVIAGVTVFSFPNLRYRLLLPFYGEKSAVSRLSLWQTGWKGIKEAPVTGLGLTGFAANWQQLNTDPGLTDTHNYPHNIVLDFWVETGLFGLISMVVLIFYTLFKGLKDKQNIYALGVSLFLIAIIFQGLVDNPYFKNDLALVFWMVLALAAYQKRLPTFQRQ